MIFRIGRTGGGLMCPKGIRIGYAPNGLLKYFGLQGEKGPFAITIGNGHTSWSILIVTKRTIRGLDPVGWQSDLKDISS